MAKKRKVKARRKVKSRRKVGRVEPGVKAMVVEKRAKPIAVQAAYNLCLAGSIILLIAGILSLIPGFSVTNLVDIFANLLCGAVILIATISMKKVPVISAIFILLFSVIALLFPPYGFIVGPVLSLIGAIILLIKR